MGDKNALKRKLSQALVKAEQKEKYVLNQIIYKEKEGRNHERWQKFGDLHEKYKFDAGRMRSTLILVDDKNLDNDNKVRLISKYK